MQTKQELLHAIREGIPQGPESHSIGLAQVSRCVTPRYLLDGRSSGSAGDQLSNLLSRNERISSLWSSCGYHLDC